MTVSSVIDTVEATGNGSGTDFPLDPMTIFATTDVQVTLVVIATGVETLLTEGVGASNYSVAITAPTALPSLATVTYPADEVTPMASTHKLVMKRVLPLTQLTDLQNQGGYFPETQEQTFDRSRMIDIQQQEEIDRSVKVAIGSSLGFDAELPVPEAGKGIGWNNDEDGFQNIDLTVTVDTSALVVVSGSEPSLVDGRIWVDTSVAGQRVIRICDGSDYNEVTRFATAGGAITGIIATTFTEALNVSDDATTLLTLTSSASGTTGSGLKLVHSKTPDANDIAAFITINAKDSGGTADDVAVLDVEHEVVTAGAEDVRFRVRTMRAGTRATRFYFGKGQYGSGTSGGDKGTDTINATDLYQAGVLVAHSDLSIQSGTTHAPVLADHGKTFIYSHASGCTVTLPAASTLFAGWSIKLVSASASAITVNRASTDVIYSANTSLTSMLLPSASDGGSLTVDSTGGSAKFYWVGKRSFQGAAFAPATSTVTTQAHSLGVRPKHVWAVLINTSTDLGYAADDEVVISGEYSDKAATAAGSGLVCDATNIVHLTGSINMKLQNKGTAGVSTNIDNAKWSFYIRAEVIN